jgi:hypothetical protein
LNPKKIAIKFKRLVDVYDKLPKLQAIENGNSDAEAWQE